MEDYILSKRSGLEISELVARLEGQLWTVIRRMDRM